MGRIQARAAAMQMVYENMMGGDGGDATLRELINFEPEEGDREYIDRILQGVESNLLELDERISALLKDWTIDRIARVDLAILRVAAYEILYHPCDVEYAAAVNEAVNLAQRFDSPESGRFINGLLRNLVREQEGEKQE